MKKLLPFLLALLLLVMGTAMAQLQPEPMGKIETLPEKWPAHWVLAHDVSFSRVMDGRTIVLDLDEENPARAYKGMMNNSFAAFMAQATTRPEIYFASIYYSRGTRGERIDVLEIYDKQTLSPIGEVVLEVPRAILLPQRFTMQLTRDESLVLLYNFTPAMSVSVVDPVARELRGEVPTPGCAAVFPTGERGFSSVCADGTLYTVQLDADGQPASTSRSAQFFDAGVDPLIEKAAWHAGKAWFPTFMGQLQPVDFTGDQPVIGEAWSMIDEETTGWRPGGLAPAAADADGRVYMLAHPEGREGSHRDPGMEVWVFDPDQQQRVDRYELAMPGLGVSLTRDREAPLLVVLNVEMALDVYDARTGELRKTVANFGAETPLLVYGAE
ncbi:MAG: amine dehydrogenase large subunit [Gammaproteobacteria bacterium]|nr:amine dehydrogenase large subunit [Gammaproteobacteria bacterium]